MYGKLCGVIKNFGSWILSQCINILCEIKFIVSNRIDENHYGNIKL
jgi:hypothetical protein